MRRVGFPSLVSLFGVTRRHQETGQEDTTHHTSPGLIPKTSPRCSKEEVYQQKSTFVSEKNIRDEKYCAQGQKYFLPVLARWRSGRAAKVKVETDCFPREGKLNSQLQRQILQKQFSSPQISSSWEKTQFVFPDSNQGVKV